MPTVNYQKLEFFGCMNAYPDEDGYTLGENVAAWKTAEIDGGLPRTRLDMLDESRVVSLKWTCNRARYEALVQFFAENLGRNREPFLMDLHASHSFYEEYICQLMPESLQLIGFNGLQYVLSASFEILSNFTEYVGPTCNAVDLGNNWPEKLYNHDIGWFAPSVWNINSPLSGPDVNASGTSQDNQNLGQDTYYAGLIYDDLLPSDVVAWSVVWTPVNPAHSAFPPTVAYPNQKTITVNPSGPSSPPTDPSAWPGTIKLTATVNGSPILGYLLLTITPGYYSGTAWAHFYG